MTMKLWHSHNARSLRPLWAMEEMGFDYELELLPFPPRVFQKDFLGVNALGTVPYFEDGDTNMTESSGICHYLVERYQRYDFSLQADHPEFGDFLNWMYHSDATLTFPQTIVMRYTHLEPEERKLPQAIEDYGKWYIARLRRLDAHIIDREFLCDGRFTIADIAISYALFFGELLGLDKDYSPQVKEYLARMKQRPAFKKVQVIGEEMSPFK
jgi:glutathione S-transferase